MSKAQFEYRCGGCASIVTGSLMWQSAMHGTMGDYVNPNSPLYQEIIAHIQARGYDVHSDGTLKSLDNKLKGELHVYPSHRIEVSISSTTLPIRG